MAGTRCGSRRQRRLACRPDGAACPEVSGATGKAGAGAPETAAIGDEFEVAGARLHPNEAQLTESRTSTSSRR